MATGWTSCANSGAGAIPWVSSSCRQKTRWTTKSRDTLWSNGIEINLPGKSVRVDGCPVVLTRMQYERLLFNRFYRPSEQVKGNGLGLAIVKAICQYHGWKVSYSYTGRHCFTVDFS